MIRTKISYGLICAAIALLSGCSTGVQSRTDSADRIAKIGAMQRQDIVTTPFILASWHKAQQGNTVARIYIEGDGLAWISKKKPSNNPTPKNPLALRLAAADPAANVFYLARPCQFTGMSDGSACPQIYWTSARTAPEVIASYNSALDHIKNTYGYEGFELIGYSGGAALAALLTAERSDIVSLRSVAGNLSYSAFSAAHNVSPLRLSRAPETIAAKISGIPQIHFIGTQDDIVPQSISADWLAQSQKNDCIVVIDVPVTHSEGWEQSWQNLILQNPLCSQ